MEDHSDHKTFTQIADGHPSGGVSGHIQNRPEEQLICNNHTFYVISR